MKLDADDVRELRPVIVEIVRSVLMELEEKQRRLPNGRIGFTESEAAAQLGVARHVLRDARLRGEIYAQKLGKKYVYSADGLRELLQGQPANCPKRKDAKC